uniref:Uncharacterized protein n=1 Tax=Globodera rostochiensis TaxID=31243 RepID=A0A914I1I0_GLORO
MANIYDEFIIVEEKRVMDFTFQNRCTAGCKDVYLCPHINSKFVDLTAFASLEFKNHWFSLYIKDIASHSTKVSGPLMAFRKSGFRNLILRRRIEFAARVVELQGSLQPISTRQHGTRAVRHGQIWQQQTKGIDHRLGSTDA